MQATTSSFKIPFFFNLNHIITNNSCLSPSPLSLIPPISPSPSLSFSGRAAVIQTAAISLPIPPGKKCHVFILSVCQPTAQALSCHSSVTIPLPLVRASINLFHTHLIPSNTCIPSRFSLHSAHTTLSGHLGGQVVRCPSREWQTRD